MATVEMKYDSAIAFIEYCEASAKPIRYIRAIATPILSMIFVLPIDEYTHC